jgi:hypothetical protein
MRPVHPFQPGGGRARQRKADPKPWVALSQLFELGSKNNLFHRSVAVEESDRNVKLPVRGVLGHSLERRDTDPSRDQNGGAFFIEEEFAERPPDPDGIPRFQFGERLFER